MIILITVIVLIVIWPEKFRQKIRLVAGCEAHDDDRSVVIAANLQNDYSGDLELVADLDLADS